MAFGDAAVQPSVNAGLASQPLVTSADTSVVGPAAVENLVNAYRNGFVTNQDILDRVGQVGQAKKKALLESLGEYVNPDVIQSRLAGARAAGAQANLQTAQAGAQQSLVAPLTQVTANQAALAKYNPADQEAFAAYGAFNPIDTNPDGSYNYTNEIRNAGYDYKAAYAKLQYAQKGLTITQKIPGVGPDGQPNVTLIGGNGDLMAPAVFKQYSDMRDSAFKDAYTVRKNRTQDNHPTPVPEPGAPSQEEVPASPTAPAAPSAPAAPQPLVTATTPYAPAPGAHTVTVNSSDGGSTTVASNPPGSGLVSQYGAATYPTGPAPGYTVPELRGDLEKQDSYKLWQQQSKAAESFDNTVREIKENDALPKNQRQPYSQLDFQLAEAAVALYQPQMAIREFKWGELTKQAVPVTEMLQNWKQIAGQTGSLTPQARKRLVDLGYSMVDGAESAARGPITGAVEAAKGHLANPENVLRGPDERRVYHNIPFGKNRPDTSVYSGAQPGQGSQPQASAPAWAPQGTFLGTAQGKPAWISPSGQYWFTK